MEYKEAEKNYKVLANRRRIAILVYLLEEKTANVGRIAGRIDLSFKSTSKHLAILASIDILEKDQRKYYSKGKTPKITA